MNADSISDPALPEQFDANMVPSRRLRVMNSILSADVLLAFIDRVYTIPSLVSCELWLPSVNDTYLMTARDGRYILRVYREGWRSTEEIAYELDLLNHLDANGVSVSVPIASSDGRLINSVRAPEGSRHVVLFTYAEGGPLKWTNVNHCRTAGRLLAAIHQQSADFVSTHTRAALDVDWIILKPLHSIQPFFRRRSNDWAYLSELGAKLQTWLRDKGSTIDWGVCHGDFGGGNVSVADGGLTAFDFDLCGPGWRACDLAAIRLVARMGKNRAIWDVFAQAYEETRPFSSADRAASRLFEPIRRLWWMGLQADHASKWGTVRLNETLLSAEMTFFRKWEAEQPIDTWSGGIRSGR